MKKRNSIIIAVVFLLISCVALLAACDGDFFDTTPVSLSGITLSVNKSSVEFGEKITLTCKYSPENARVLWNEDLKKTCLEFYLKKGDTNIKLKSKNDGTCDYIVNEYSDMTFWAKYCNHPKAHDDTEWDVVSNDVNVKLSANTISTVEELKSLAGKTEMYILNADLDLASESNWSPINNFSGALLGNGHTISNLKINATNKENLGLFSELKGKVLNLSVKNADITASGNIGFAGIIAGKNAGIIDSVQVSGNIKTPYYDNVGGIAGYNYVSAEIKNCTNNATIQAATNIGGIVGAAFVDKNEVISNNKNFATIKGNENVGGVGGYVAVPGWNEYKKFEFTLSQNNNEGDISGNSNVGGVFGQLEAKPNTWYSEKYYNYFNIISSNNIGKVVAKYDCVGGVIGKATKLKEISVSENNADVSGKNYVGSLVGYAPNANVVAVSSNKNTISGYGYVGGFAGYAGIISNATNDGNIISKGGVVEDSTTRAYVGGIAGYCEGLKECENNVDIIVKTSGSYVGGLAGYIMVQTDNAINDNVNNGKIEGGNNVGGIAGCVLCISLNDTKRYTYNLLNNNNNGAIKGIAEVAGIFGRLYAQNNTYYASKYPNYFTVSMFSNKGIVEASGDYAGGIIGYGTRVSVISFSDNNADITGGNYTGGIVGYSADTKIQMVGKVNQNKITGKSYLGGIAGYTGIIYDAVNEGSIITTGCIVEDNEKKSYMGGIAGYCLGVLNSTNNSDINAVNFGWYVGGIAGYINVNDIDIVNNNVNNGRIEGYCYVGGISGYLTNPNLGITNTKVYTISHNINNGEIAGGTNLGGIVGCAYSTRNQYYASYYNNYIQVVYCENNAQISGGLICGGIIGSGYNVKTQDEVMNTNKSVFTPLLGLTL